MRSLWIEGAVSMYLFLSTQPSGTDANTILHLALRVIAMASREHKNIPYKPARLSKAEICDWTHPAMILCDELLDSPKFCENPILFALALPFLLDT